MKFIKLTSPYEGRPFFVRPELIISFGSSLNFQWNEPPEHHAWVRVHGDSDEMLVVETVEEIARPLDIDDV